MIHILLFANLAQQAETEKVSIEVNSTLSVEEVRTLLQQKVGKLTGIENALVAVNEEYVELTDQVKDGDTVAFIPPVSGG
ncbi:molybdopterin converting factor subunit 1 [Fictibacillus phosphorivorans]|uniref:Molybdopterin synthase sulfur carrier subunit n=1 Tax=Fictibacillus phosphorivorans TaxID=1221500 RepID=A0A161IPM6_9BACL|nr:molybdopterin synthase sulfur carrier subunit [Fictibacillus phosphorivorans]MQR96772.1 molybdopterin converting factor subunit 1 [Fictibacillus phosphorivorans]